MRAAQALMMGGVSRIPAQIGSILTPTYNSSDYDKVGNLVSSGVTFGTSTIRLTGFNIGSLTDYILYKPTYLDSENSIKTVYFTVNTIGSVQSAFFIGYKGISGQLINIGIGLSTSLLGKLVVWVDNTFVSLSATGITMNVNDVIKFEFSCAKNIFTLTATNMTAVSGTLTLSASYTYNYNYPFTNIIPSGSRAMFAPFGANCDITITSWGVTTSDYTYSDLLHMGDSKVDRYFSSASGGISDLWQTANPTKRVYNLSGANETSNHFVLRLPELQLYKPKILIIYAPSNDVRLGVSSATTQANLTTIRNAMMAIGCDVWYQNPPLENTSLSGVNLSSLVTDGAAVFLSNRIMLQPPTWNVSTDNTADGYHWPSAANIKIYNNQITYITI